MASNEDPALSQLLRGFRRLLESGDLSDLTVWSADRRYAVHRAVVCPQSTFFWTACTQAFKERTSHEIDMRKDDPDAVHSMIQYFYTLVYPSNSPGHTTEVNVTAGENHAGIDTSQLTGQGVADGHVPASTAPATDNEDVVGEEENNRQEVTKTVADTDGDRSKTCIEEHRAATLAHLHHDMLVYAIAEKYGIPDLQSKAANHFLQELQQAEITIDFFDVVREVYLITPVQDRGLRDIVVAKTYSEVQHWTGDDRFMNFLSCEGDFCADLLVYIVKEDRRQYEAALANIEHPGYCQGCQATLILKRWVSKKRNVQTKKYCARCDPWG